MAHIKLKVTVQHDRYYVNGPLQAYRLIEARGHFSRFCWGMRGQGGSLIGSWTSSGT